VIGFGPAESGVIDFEFPISFNITITPHDEKRAAIGRRHGTR